MITEIAQQIQENEPSTGRVQLRQIFRLPIVYGQDNLQHCSDILKLFHDDSSLTFFVIAISHNPNQIKHSNQYDCLYFDQKSPSTNSKNHMLLA
jgi:hypothetical protein